MHLAVRNTDFGYDESVNLSGSGHGVWLQLPVSSLRGKRHSVSDAQF